MKKFILGLGIFIMFSASAYAGNYTCVAPYDLSHGSSRFLSNITGSNFMAERVAQSLMKKSLAKSVEGKIKVKVTSYSVKDLKKGIFKSFKLDGNNVNLDGIHFSNLKMNTLCNFNYVSLSDPKNPVFKEDVALAFAVTITEDDLNNTMQTSAYKKVISDLNRLGGSFGVFSISSTQIKIRNNQFFYITQISVPFVKTVQNVVITSDLKIHNGEIDFANTKLVNENRIFDLKKIDRIINYINPLDFALDILENKNAVLTVENVKIQDNKIFADGFVVIPKD